MNDVHNECIKSHNDMIESRNELFKTMQSLVEMLRQQEQATNLSTHTPETSRRFNSICYDDDDDEESTIPLNEIIFQIPSSIAITPVLPTMELEDSLIMGDEGLRTIFEKESNEFIKFSVEDLVPIPRESEDTSDRMMMRIADIPSLELNEDECFDPGGGEIDADIPPNFKDDYYNSEGDIIYLESLLINDTIPPEVFLDHDPKRLNDEPNIDNLKIKENVRFTFEDRHYLSLTFVIKIFLPFLTYPVNSLLLLSFGSEDTIFDPDISAYSFYSLEPVTYESLMTIFPFFYFCPKDQGIRGEIAPDYEDSRARGFVHRSLELQSLACLYMGIQYPRFY
ncbi:hypothetical protein Tco_0502007 [Tanacetum coccineum]